jgi:hypothetical protein
MARIEEEHAVETFESIIQISLTGLKLLALFNGGAAVAVLAYLGNVAGKGLTVPSMRTRGRRWEPAPSRRESPSCLPEPRFDPARAIWQHRRDGTASSAL